MVKRRLSQRQKARIHRIQEKRRQRLNEQVAQALEQSDQEQAREGQIISRHGANFAVTDQESGQLYQCLCRQNLGQLVCGDRIVWQPTGCQQGVITALLKRETVLSRPDYRGQEKPLVANLSQLVIVLAVAPEPSGYLLDQYLVAAEISGIHALIAVNKSDLLSAQNTSTFWQKHFALYQQIGYPLIQVSAKSTQGLDPLIQHLQHETSVLVGQSGVGKSSLIKSLLPDREVLIGQLSKTTGFGRHTTSATTLYSLPQGGYLIDSPGVRSFRLPSRLNQSQLEAGFREFHPYLGHCRFANCRHQHEPDCALQAAVSTQQIHPKRLFTFHQLLAELA